MSKDDENVDARFINFNSADDNTFNSKNSIDDNDLSDFNKERLKFYVELNKTVKNNPKILKKLINKYNGVTRRKVYEKDIYRNIISNKSKLKDTNNDLFELIKENLKDNDKPSPTVPLAPDAEATSLQASTGTQSGGRRIKGGALDFKKYFESDENGDKLIKEFNNSNKQSKKDLIKQLKKEYTLNNVTEDDDDTNFQDKENSMQKFINEYFSANEKYKKVKNDNEGNVGKDGEEGIKAKKAIEDAETELKTNVVNAVDEFDNDPMNSLDILAIKNDDRIVFIVITFVIRYITLLLVNWCVEIDIIRSFNQAFMLFSFIYIIIFWLIVMIINVNISPEYSGETSIIGKVQSVLYYFHFRINDIGRLLAHTLLIILLLIIPIIIKKEEKKNDEPLTYDERIDLYKTLSLFTIFMWIFTSIIASKY
jgi:hypothetical protein